jgi:hypothetical protein
MGILRMLWLKVKEDGIFILLNLKGNASKWGGIRVHG